MNEVIYKETVRVDDSTHVRLMSPVDQIVHVEGAKEYGFISFWFIRDREYKPNQERSFRVVGTGHPYEGKYVGTAVVLGGSLVWHLIEVTDL